MACEFGTNGESVENFWAEVWKEVQAQPNLPEGTLMTNVMHVYTNLIMHLPFDELILMNWGTGSSGISVLWDT